ncbi:MAG TPA: penicillin acylase family protein [Terriglobales bacterium]
MATATSPVETTPRFPVRRKWLFGLIGLLGLLLLVFLVLAGWVYFRAHRALPQVDGTMTVPGLTAPVHVIRDAQGVPHIQAANVDDLFFAQGYVTAQDRLWQMDISRRYAAGELAEIFGPRLLEHDIQQRYLQIRNSVERALSGFNPRDRQFLEDYARGVNAFINSHRDGLPLEFAILRYQPKPWRVADSLLVGANMSQMLNTQYDVELWREKVIQHLTPELIGDLYPNRSWRDHPPGAESETLNDQTPSGVPNPRRRTNDRRHTSVASAFGFSNPLPSDCEDCLPGSNNWAISGEHTVSGKPLLSNDMHLSHQIPNIWYEAHLKSGDFDVAGLTLPGLPFVMVGHNQRIAWGFTNLGPDVEDLFIENLNQNQQLETPKGFVAPERHFETIHVKGARDLQFDVIVTQHGPIITPILPGERRQLALQWTLYDPTVLTDPFFDVDSARNWQEFRAAFSKFGGPSENVVYADVDGHIGYQATGKIPIRPSGDGLLPVSGADDSHNWKGYIPFDELPSVFDPPSGMIATANARITPDNYRYLLANNWFEPYRTERIYRVLDNGQKFKPADMLNLQTDIYSDVDHFFADHFVYAIDRSKNVSERVRRAAEIMRGWDGRMVADSAAPTIAYYSRRRLMRLILQPKLGADYEFYSWGRSMVALETIVDRRVARWLPPSFANYDELLVKAVEETLEAAPRDLTSWNWGNQFPIEIQHPVLGSIPVLRWFSGTGKHPQSGDGVTVKQIGRTFGPSERMTVDFSNLDNSTLNIVVGQSGHLLSPHYKDQFKAWYEGSTFNLPFSGSAVQSAKQHELTLTPGK